MAGYDRVHGVNVRYKWIFARREEQLLEAQKRYGFERITKRYADLLEDPEVDVIDLCTPPYMHAEEAILALNHGKHVICEKPLTGYFGNNDDMELALGTAVFQKGGGTKGHNGLKSIRDRCGGEDFFRLRIGIGRPDKGSPAVYVLSPFPESEKASLNALFSRIASYGVFSIPENLHLKV